MGWRRSNEGRFPGKSKTIEAVRGTKRGRECPPGRAQGVRGAGIRPERESHVSLRQPYCAADPYVPTPVSITSREGGRGSAQRLVGSEEEDWR